MCLLQDGTCEMATWLQISTLSGNIVYIGTCEGGWLDSYWFLYTSCIVLLCHCC